MSDQAQIPQAAGITGILSAAGLTDAEVHAWFGQPRRELAGLTPGVAATLAPGGGESVLELARADAVAVSRDRRTGGISLPPRQAPPTSDDDPRLEDYSEASRTLWAPPDSDQELAADVQRALPGGRNG